MSWFNKWFRKPTNRLLNQYATVESVSSSSSMNDKLLSEGIRMNLHIANGGYVIEFTKYDNRKDRNDRSIYVIPDGEDFGQKLSEIIVQYILTNGR